MLKFELVITAKTTNVKCIDIEQEITCNIECTYCKHRHDKNVEIYQSSTFYNDKGEAVNFLMKCRNCDKKLICRMKSMSKEKDDNYTVSLFELNGCVIDNVCVRKMILTSSDKSIFEIDGTPGKWKDRDGNGKEVSFCDLKIQLRPAKK